MTPREKFQQLLKKLSQFDCAELDFFIEGARSIAPVFKRRMFNEEQA